MRSGGGPRASWGLEKHSLHYRDHVAKPRTFEPGDNKGEAVGLCVLGTFTLYRTRGE